MGDVVVWSKPKPQLIPCASELKSVPTGWWNLNKTKQKHEIDRHPAKSDPLIVIPSSFFSLPGKNNNLLIEKQSLYEYSTIPKLRLLLP